MEKMTSKERLLAAIDGKPVDRIPVSPRVWRFALGKNASQVDLARKYDFDLLYCDPGVFNASDQVLMTPVQDILCETSDTKLPDITVDIKKEREGKKIRAERTIRTPGGILNDIVLIPDTGSEYGINPDPHFLEPLVKNEDDVELLPYLLPRPELVRTRFPVERALERDIGDTGLISFRPTIGVDEMVVNTLGVTQSLILSIENPDMFNRMIDIFDQWHMAVMKIVLEDGWKLIFDAWYNFSLSLGWSPGFYRRIVFPLIKRHTDFIHTYDAKMFFYDDGDMAGSIDAIVETGADIIQTLPPPPTGDIDYKELSARHGGKACFNCGVDTVKIRYGKPGEIEQDVREVLDIMAPGGKFILGTSDSIPDGSPEENVMAFFSTAREYGQEIAGRLYGK